MRTRSPPQRNSPANSVGGYFSTPEKQNGSFFGADPYVTVSLEHLFADVSGQRTNGFFAHGWIFGKARNESMAEIMPGNRLRGIFYMPISMPVPADRGATLVHFPLPT
jgi:hypothetical protein